MEKMRSSGLIIIQAPSQFGAYNPNNNSALGLTENEIKKKNEIDEQTIIALCK